MIPLACQLAYLAAAGALSVASIVAGVWWGVWVCALAGGVAAAAVDVRELAKR